MIRHLLRFALLQTLFITSLTGMIYAQSLLLEQTATEKKYAPQSSKVAMIYMRFQSVNGNTSLSSVKFKNAAPTVFLGSGVKRATLFKDSLVGGVTGSFDDGQETQLATIEFGTNPTGVDQEFSGFSDTVTSGNTSGYFIVYEIADNAQLGATTSITVLDINNQSFDFGSNTVVNSVVITGLEGKEITSIVPDVVLPAQTNVPILKVALKMSGEDMNEAISIVVKNLASNFVTTSGLKNGITTAYLYKGIANQDTFDPLFIDNYTIVQQINAGEFTSSSSATFLFPDENELNINAGITTNFFVVYDIGDDFQVTDDTKINGQISALSGLGEDSRLSISIPNALPSQPAEAYVGGLSYNSDEINSLVPGGAFGANSIVPMLEFEIRANQTAINVVTINIQNPGSVPFITTSSDPKNVQKISLYLDGNLGFDQNRNGVFDSTSSGLDTLLAETYLGRGSNQTDRAVITMNSLTAPLIIPQFDSDADDTDGYNNNNAARFFVVYTFGQNIFASQTSVVTSNSNAHAIARLENVIGTVNISNDIYSVRLSGSKPVSSSPEALINLSDSLDVFITSSTALSPTMAIRGQVLVPMLYLTLDSTDTFPSTNVSIFNESSSFSPSNEGVSKVWIYSDVNSNMIVDSGDTLLGVRDLPSNTATASIGAVPLNTGRNNWIVLYNIGVNTAFPVGPNFIPNVRAQLGSIQAQGNLVVGGQSLPFPSTAATLTPSASRLTVSDVTASALSSSAIVKNFVTSITLTNTTDTAINVTELTPRFYLSTIAGTDISYEFIVNPDEAAPYVVPANGSKQVVFSGNHSTRVSAGNVLIDAYAEYVVPDSIYPVSESTGLAELIRYNGTGGWTPAYVNPPRFTIGSETVYSWSFPAYILNINVIVNENVIPFANFDAIPQQSEMKIALVNNGANIDENSLVIKINGVALTKGTNISGGSSGQSILNAKTQALTYSYDSSTGIITIQDIGSVGGTLTIDVNDIQGNPLTTTVINFSISDVVKIQQFYAYPSPYVRSASQPLSFGFSLTQPATVKMYIYNHVGILVYQNDYSYSDIGYHVISFTQNESFISSGIYICKLYATDANGNKSNAVTKFAIY